MIHISRTIDTQYLANNRYKAFKDVVIQKNIENIVVETELGLHQDYEKIIHKLFEDHPDVDGIFDSSDMIAIADQVDGREVAFENVLPIELKERKTT